ncbi:hypothetical protein Ahy_A03g016656 [Arachis hypogaea]|uniref:PB1-like domain-containing protein n=1 Tax=Arachis hypogaea TaxID=3818 RepID=A0A445E460_ARAHY|nr:hypothetical protein Ahy_A03g016656 [Arachis hypogaea]
MNAEVLDIIFHHGRNFEKDKDGRWTYYPDNKHFLGEVDVDRLDLEYEKIKKVWWQVLQKGLEVGLRRLNSNNKCVFMVEKNNGVIDVYIEHEISEPAILQGQDVIVHLDDQVMLLCHHYPKPFSQNYYREATSIEFEHNNQYSLS